MPQNKEMERKRSFNGRRCSLHFDRLNYFTAVVPKVEEFNKKFIESGKVKNLKDLAEADIDELRKV